MPKKKTILVIDDEPDIRAIASIALRAAGYNVTESGDGREALRAIRQSKPDMIIMDLMMPEMNGIEFCRRMLDELKMDDTPVLMISGVNRKAKIVGQFMELPLKNRHFEPKPVEADFILSKATEMCGPATNAKVKAGSKAAGESAEPKLGSRTPSEVKPSQEAWSEKGSRAPRLDESKGPRLTILVIDDEEDIRALLKTALGLRHNVETAEHGMDALGMIDRVDPDLVISDINMPVMNGLETIEAIRRHPRYGDIPVFFLTAETDTNLPRKTYDLGGNLYLRKPLDPIRLLNLIDRFVAEVQLTPRPPRKATDSAPARTPAAKAQGAAGKARPGRSDKVRILTIDYDVANTKLMKAHLEENGPDGCETLWTEDLRTALGNLNRWEPDVVFYNPRNPGMDGIAFAQNLKIKKLNAGFELAFVGREFFEADAEYSQKRFGRNVINITLGDREVRGALVKVIEDARTHVRQKSLTLDRLLAEDQAHRDKINQQRNRINQQRSDFREKFAHLQSFIDREPW